MPLDLSERETTNVIGRRRIPGKGLLPADVTGLVVRELSAVGDDQAVHRRVMVAWSYPLQARPAKRFLVYLRNSGDDLFDRVGEADHETFVIGGLVVGPYYEVAVIGVGLDCCARQSPERTSARVRFRLYGQEDLPAAPTDLKVTQVDGRAIASWGEISYHAPVRYELRAGRDTWVGAQVLGITRDAVLDITRLLPDVGTVTAPNLVIMVAAVTATGLTGSPARLSGFTTAAQADLAVAHAASGLGHAGTLSGLTNSGTTVRVSDGETSGTWQVGPFDAGAVDSYELLALVEGVVENVGLTIGMSWFTLGSVEAGRRRIEGGTAEWFPEAGLDRPSSPEIGEITGTLAGTTGLVIGSLSEDRDPDTPDTLTIAEAEFTIGSDFGGSWTIGGPVSSVGTGYSLEVAWSDDNVTYTAWEPYQRQTRSFRYAQLRLTMTQPAVALRPTVYSIHAYVVQPRVLGQRWVEETPTGVINSSNDEFTLSEVPATSTLMLFLDGALQRPGVDYSIASQTITYTVPPTTGSWHLAKYQR